MGLDIRVDKSYVLRSGARLEMGTEELPNYAECNLVNPEMWYQKECHFLSPWARRNLEPAEGAYYDERYDEYYSYKLPLDKVVKLIADCNAGMRIDRSLPPEEVRRQVEAIIGPPGKSVAWRYEKGYGDSFFDDLYKVAKSMPRLLGYMGDEDVEFTLYFGW